MRKQIPVAWSCFLLILCSATSGCASGHGQAIKAPGEALRSIYVLRRGWHTGIAIAVRDWPDRDWSLLDDFREVDYLEFGWGDERYYQAERATAWLATRAALWPTTSVIHVIGLREPVPEKAQARDVVEVSVPVSRLQELAAAIRQEFSGEDPVFTGVTLSMSPQPNRFYHARRDFHFPRMCNWWAARLLEEAGCDITPATVLFAARVVDEARDCAGRYGNGPAGNMGENPGSN